MTNMDQYTELRSRIAGVRRRWNTRVALRTGARATAAAAVPVLAALGVERTIAPEGVALMLLAAATTVAVGAAAAVPLWRMRRRPEDRQVARFIEERARELPGGRALDDALVSAVDAARSPDHGVFLPFIVDDAVRRLRAIDPSDIVTRQSIRHAAGQAVAGAAMLTLALAAGAPAFGRAMETARLRLFPASVRVDVTPGNVRIPAGSSVRIRTTLHASAGTLRRLAPTLTVTSGPGRRTVPMVAAGDGFEYVIQSVDRTVSYSVTAGAAQSDAYTVTALFAPRVNRIDLHYTYPAFAGLAPRDEEDGGDIYAPEGTRVRLRIHTDKPIAQGLIALGGGPAVAVRPAGDRIAEAELLLAKDDSYRIRLADADGVRSSGDTEYFIRLMDDRPPDVRILRPSSDQEVTPLEEIAIEARADDDYGIAAFDLVYSVAGGAERIVPFDRLTGTNVQKIGTRLLPAEDLGVKPGDVITYYARARDVARGKRSTLATSDIFFLEVKPFNEEFVAAQSQAGAGAGDPQIESLIEAQKAIISSTWNVERRAHAGRSADDVKAIAQAQAELKARAEQMAPRAPRGRVRMPAPERVTSREPQRAGAAAGDPIAAAVEGMTKALQQLATEHTKEALPHEMAALHGLLQAQAEVRRSQVSQQTDGAGSGGSNRSGQDLSALFDKELQRQQRTNYETQSAVETRPDQRDSQESALDRIRDLARRQEDLNRRQRELAQAGLSAEEMKRQIEKLTREQTELREQAEALAKKQMGASGQGQTGRGDLQAASDQMRSAASEMRREDPGAAAQSGQRAAQHLRRLEQQVRGGSSGARERAASDVQLEAQQIAQEQRRIAAEAARLDKSAGAAAADARRRLADEKDRLAGRVDELQRSARQLGEAHAKGADAAALSGAARELERGRVAERMRDSSRQMRAAAAGRSGGTAHVEQEIARALERVADTLDSSASAETRQLSNRLDQTRAIRDRLQRLEQQMRAADARDPAAAGRQPARRQNGQPGRQSQAGQQGRSGQPGSPGQPASAGQPAPSGQSGREGRGGSAGSGPAAAGNGRAASGELQRLQQEYQRELQRAQDALGRLSRGESSGANGSTPEQQEFSRSAPGTEAFKQDRAGWESLRKDIDMALEKYEARVSDRLARKRSEDRFSAGGSDRVPEGYRRPIAKYFESLAKVKK